MPGSAPLMVVGEVAEQADVVVIGGGPGGYAAALRCADLLDEARVVLVERDAVGGVCLNVGCIPSKVLIHAADVAALPHRSAEWGVTLTAEVDVDAVHTHRRTVVDQLTGGVRTLLDAAGVEVWSGTARFSRPNRLAVVDGPDVRHLEFGHAVVATGSRPAALGVLPLDGERIVDSTGGLAFPEVPPRLCVVGGGYIGVELGTAWAKLGSAVTIVEAADRLLPHLPARAGREVARRLRDLGVEVQTNHPMAGPDDPLVAAADRVIVAVGRTPNTDELGLATAGIEVDPQGRIPVGPDRRCVGASASILAIGDVTAGPALAHKATAEAEVAADTIAGRPAAFDPAAIPEVVFSDPEIAAVGLDLDAATAAGIDASSFRFPYAAGSRSRTIDDTAGFVELVADADHTIIGALAVGAGVTELAGELALAVELAATVDDLAATIHPHPTMSEAIGEAALGLAGHPLHVRRARR